MLLDRPVHRYRVPSKTRLAVQEMGAQRLRRQAIAARKRWFTMLGLLASKWPHTQSIEPGGSTRAVDGIERTRLLARIREFRRFLEQQLIAAPLEQVLSLANAADDLQALEAEVVNAERGANRNPEARLAYQIKGPKDSSSAPVLLLV
ncbi:hypothetical protein [Variovorax paradoxus]|uniref:hypothetical protein n=1 Tax=Variovorax paradoxus TaxID=34073 RepID=UPI003F517989